MTGSSTARSWRLRVFGSSQHRRHRGGEERPGMGVDRPKPQDQARHRLAGPGPMPWWRSREAASRSWPRRSNGSKASETRDERLLSR
jgi:hypothetical protein